MSDDKWIEIINRIKNRRIELGLSYQDLADKTGMSKSTLQRYETGAIRSIPLDKLEDLANALEMDPAFLMGFPSAEENYYLDPGAAEMAQELYARPEIRVLFDASRNATAEDVQMAAELLLFHPQIHPPKNAKEPGLYWPRFSSACIF